MSKAPASDPQYPVECAPLFPEGADEAGALPAGKRTAPRSRIDLNRPVSGSRPARAAVAFQHPVLSGETG